jgi:hypothetical protein
MLKGGPSGCLGMAHVSGWPNSSIFVEYLKHFIQHVKPSNSNKALLIFDDHDSHCSVEVVNLAKKNSIILLTIPPYTSHKLQPLDRSVFGLYKTYYNAACKDWMNTHLGTPITIYEVAELCGKSYPLAFDPVNIQVGFRGHGYLAIESKYFPRS